MLGIRKVARKAVADPRKNEATFIATSKTNKLSKQRVSEREEWVSERAAVKAIRLPGRPFHTDV